MKKTLILTIVTQTSLYRLPPLRIKGQRSQVLQSLPLAQNNHSPFLRCTNPIQNLLFRIWRVHWSSQVPMFRVPTLRLLTVGQSIGPRRTLSCGLSPITTREWLNCLLSHAILYDVCTCSCCVCIVKDCGWVHISVFIRKSLSLFNCVWHIRVRMLFPCLL